MYLLLASLSLFTIVFAARDVQKWEYIPLGPFTAKNLGTSISPWVVTTLALEPFIVDNFPQDPVPFAYLVHKDNFNFDISLQVDITRKFYFNIPTIFFSFVTKLKS